MGENLSEAPKAGGRGENLVEAPLLSFKKKKRSLSENLSEALKADGKGENLIESPLMSFKKKKREKKRQGQQVHNVAMHAGYRYSMKEKRSLNSKTRVLIMLPGHLTSIPSKNTHLLQGLGTI